MGLVYGMDEAGYGPNLGPLVVTVTVWEVPGDPRRFNFWNSLSRLVTQQRPAAGDQRLHIADSKQVYQPARGLATLERGVLTLLRALGIQSDGYQQLCRQLTACSDGIQPIEPWFDGHDLPLPHAETRQTIDDAAVCWSEGAYPSGVRFCEVRSEIVLTQRFNRLVRRYGGKAAALSRISLQLLRAVWNLDCPEPKLIVADKHGGRNRYDQLLAEVLDGHMILRQNEGRELSQYRVGPAEIRFQTRAESHFPVAVASMICKYLRELSMTLFNRFWCSHVAGLKPTKGYPVDARRFKTEIAQTQSSLGIGDDVLWRNR